MLLTFSRHQTLITFEMLYSMLKLHIRGALS